MKPIRIAISPCLVGRPIRYDGTGRRAEHIIELLESHDIELIPTCPEFAIGLGVPRPKIQLQRQPDDRVRLVMPERNRLDLTERMVAFVENRVAALMELDLHGYIFKAHSPSCGIDDVEVLYPDGQLLYNGTGFLAKEILERMPHLPVTDEQRLLDPAVREEWWKGVTALASKPKIA